MRIAEPWFSTRYFEPVTVPAAPRKDGLIPMRRLPVGLNERPRRILLCGTHGRRNTKHLLVEVRGAKTILDIVHPHGRVWVDPPQEDSDLFMRNIFCWVENARERRVPWTT
jgi:hypothetical protein